ncbi:RNA methyltransferase [Hyphobacterium sp. HN65]|uniref:RNA methyltransferase n=1 Tax=Hyphobacterium lacteum TaxID=3116575 RepID=A0ABU7LQI1_9PROT|nr:RNA methyltransferase [Hyphobacterium sp. HN65]MEE2526166.1 RNA methyltransferase [Hyphobacterium sp. HN65]
MQSPAFILHQPQMGENIGAAARVMGNFGLRDLRLIDPRDGWPNQKAESVAVGSPVLENVKVEFEPTAAMAGLTRIYATTARPRGMEKRVLTPRQAMAEIRAAHQAGERAGVLFGAEKSGLPNELVADADAIITLPVDREFWSLNLAQTVACCAYEWRAGEDVSDDFEEISDPASKEDMDRLFVHLESELERAGFFHPPEKTPLMVNNLRSALVRGRFTEQEVRTFRGAIKALALGRGKARIVRDD